MLFLSLTLKTFSALFNSEGNFGHLGHITPPDIAAISETRESNAALRFKGAMESR